tara:strand:+ start:201 stop:593 length:393 start_codon:yes stop_codon:yes gene_type:complete
LKRYIWEAERQYDPYCGKTEPEDYRPSGSVNLSRIDNVKLVLKHIDFDKSTYYDSQGYEYTIEKGLVHPLGQDMMKAKPIPVADSANDASYWPGEQFIPTPYTGGWLYVYGRHKNVLRIKSGMAGLAYAN